MIIGGEVTIGVFGEPLSAIHVPNTKIKTIESTKSNAVFKLIRDYLPGPYTFILPTSSGLPRIYKKRKEVGIRMPDNPVICGICRELGHPMLSMSVHYDPEEPEYATDPELIHERYEDQVDMVVDGGYGDVEGSTVVNCTAEPFSIIRHGKGHIVLHA